MVADGVSTIEDSSAEPYFVLRLFCIGTEQGDCAGCFGQNILAVGVYERYHATARVQSEGGKLGKGGEGAVA